MTTQPAQPRPHSIRAAAIAGRLKSGHGRELAKILWWTILALGDGPVWRSNLDLGEDAGLPWSDPEQRAQRAVKCLRDAGMINTEMGQRPRAIRKHGRIITAQVRKHAPILMPDRESMAELWTACREARPRPAALVSLAVSMHVLASHDLGERPSEWARVPGSRADLRRFSGGRQGSTFDRRVSALESIGMVRLERGIWVAPACEW